MNRDGLISEGEFAFALSSLGLSVSVKDASRACSLDPDGSGTVEFSELQRAFLDGAEGTSPRSPTICEGNRCATRANGKLAAQGAPSRPL